MRKNMIVAVVVFLAIVTVVSANADTISAGNCFADNGTAVVEGGVCKGTFSQGLKIEIWLEQNSPVFSGESEPPVTVFRIRNESTPSFVSSWYEYKAGGYSGKLEYGEEFYGTAFGSVTVSAIRQPWGFSTWGDEGIPQLTFSASVGRYATSSQRVPEPATSVLFWISSLFFVLYKGRYHMRYY